MVSPGLSLAQPRPNRKVRPGLLKGPSLLKPWPDPGLEAQARPAHHYSRHIDRAKNWIIKNWDHLQFWRELGRVHIG
jgi:hypothetical protein